MNYYVITISTVYECIKVHALVTEVCVHKIRSEFTFKGS